MEKETASNGLGFGSVLTIVFVTLKLCEVITWSWWWVLAPIWAPVALVITILGFIVLIRTIIN